MEQFNLLNHITNNDDYIVVWLYNIGVERYWGNEISLIKDKKENTIVNHMEEMNLLLTRKQDFMIMRKYPNAALIAELKTLSCEIPNILCPQIENEEKTISELVLEDEQLLNKLKIISSKYQKLYFVPYGISYLEEKIASLCGMKLYGADSSIQKTINNKIFAHKVANYLGYKTTESRICKNIEEIRDSYAILKKKYDKIVIKSPCSASGKGMWVINTAEKLKSICLILNRLQKFDEGYVVEGWQEKKADLNYQIYVSEKGDVNVFSIKEQILNETVYIGSIMPARVSSNIINEWNYYTNMVFMVFLESMLC